MAYVNMQVAPSGGLEDVFAYEYNGTLTAAGNGEWVLIPNAIGSITIILEVTAGSGYVEVTNDTVYEVKQNTAVGLGWDDGTVTQTTQSVVLPVTAIRQVNVTGTTTLKLRAQ